MSRTLLGGGRESAAEWAAVASHENAHTRGFLEEKDAHMSGLSTYLGVTGNLGITADDNLVTEMLFGALLNDNSANEDGVYHWALAMKEDGSGTYGWREDGSLDFNISLDELLNNSTFMERMGPKGDELKKLIQNGSSHPNDNSDGLTLTIGYETMNEGLAQTLGAYLGMGKSDGEITMHAQGSNPPPKALDEFVKGTITLKDVSEKITLAMASINNLENGVAGYTDIVVNNTLHAMYEAMYAVDRDILVENSVETVTGLIGEGTDTNPYLPLTGNIRLTCFQGYRFVTQDFYDGLSENYRENFPLNDYAKNPHLHTDLASDNPSLISAVTGSLTLQYDSSFGLQGMLFSDESNGSRAYLYNHQASESLMNVLAVFGQKEVQMRQLAKDSYIMDGIAAGVQIGIMGSTGISAGNHVDFGIYDNITKAYQLDRRNNDYYKNINFSDVYNNVINFIKVEDWAKKFSGLDQKCWYMGTQKDVEEYMWSLQ